MKRASSKRAEEAMGAFFGGEFLLGDEEYFLEPVLRYFNHKPFHMRTESEHWDAEWNTGAMMAEFKRHLLRSEVKEGRKDGDDPQNLLFRLPGNVFVHYHRHQALDVYASTTKVATETLADLRKRFHRPSQRANAEYFLLSNSSSGLNSATVPVVKPFVIGPEEMALHYGADFPAWEEGLVEQLTTELSGLTVLRGEPGTGKTSFIRHLMFRLRETHRFFVIPTNHFDVLTSPDLVSFWGESHRYNGKRNLFILEDAEVLLECRGADNRERVANLLNLTDGLLGEFMRFQAIVTANCAMDRMDPAIKRKGRLLAYREFRRLTAAEGKKLAQAKGITLKAQADYSLAEIFKAGPNVDAEPKKAPFGFGR